MAFGLPNSMSLLLLYRHVCASAASCDLRVGSTQSGTHHDMWGRYARGRLTLSGFLPDPSGELLSTANCVGRGHVCVPLCCSDWITTAVAWLVAEGVAVVSVLSCAFSPLYVSASPAPFQRGVVSLVLLPGLVRWKWSAALCPSVRSRYQ